MALASLLGAVTAAATAAPFCGLTKISGMATARAAAGFRGAPAKPGGLSGSSPAAEVGISPRLPNMSLLPRARHPADQGQDRASGRLGRGAAAPGDVESQGLEKLGRLRPGTDLGNHLAVARGGAEDLRFEGNDDRRLDADRTGEVADRDFGTLGNADLIENEAGRPVIRPCGLEKVDEVLGVAKAGKLRAGSDDDVVRLNEGGLGPRRPDIGHIDDDIRNADAHHIENVLQRLLVDGMI